MMGFFYSLFADYNHKPETGPSGQGGWQFLNRFSWYFSKEGIT